MMAMLFVLTVGASANAGTARDWWRGFCARHLIADDVWPYAEESDEWLLERYHLTGDAQVRRELRARGLREEQE